MIAINFKIFTENLLLLSIFLSGFLFLGYTLQHDIIFLFFSIVFLNYKRILIYKNLATFLFILLIINSVRGFINFDFDLQKLRWVLFFLTTFLFLNYISHTSFTFSNNFNKKLIKILVLKNIIYLIFGISAEIIGISRFELQPGHSHSFLFGTTAYFLFTNIFFLITVNDLKKVKYWKKLIISTLLLTVAIYYESRVSLIVTLLFMLLLFFEFKLKKLIPLILLAPIVISILVSYITFSDFLKIYNTVVSPYDSTLGANDFDRFSHIVGASNFVFDFNNFPYNLMGYGARTSSFTIGNEIINYFGSIGVDFKFFNESEFLNIGTNSYSGLLMDNGLIFLIILLLILYNIVRISFTSDNTLNILSFTLCFILYLFVIDLRDLPILYLFLSSTVLFKLFRNKSKDSLDLYR